MLVFLLGLWNGWRGSTYQACHVNACARALRANLTLPHSIVCVTDQPKGLDMQAVDYSVPLWELWPGLETWKGRPNCFHRLRMYDPAWQEFILRAAFPPFPDALSQARLVSMDIDAVITGNMDHLFAGMEPFKITEGRACRYNGSLQMLRPGTHAHVHDDFAKNPLVAANQILATRWNRGGGLMSRSLVGSDQAWLHIKVPDAPIWGRADGVHMFTTDEHLAKVKQPGECLWFFPGGTNPWSVAVARPSRHGGHIGRAPRLGEEWRKYAD